MYCHLTILCLNFAFKKLWTPGVLTRLGKYLLHKHKSPSTDSQHQYWVGHSILIPAIEGTETGSDPWASQLDSLTELVSSRFSEKKNKEESNCGRHRLQPLHTCTLMHTLIPHIHTHTKSIMALNNTDQQSLLDIIQQC